MWCGLPVQLDDAKTGAVRVLCGAETVGSAGEIEQVVVAETIGGVTVANQRKNVKHGNRKNHPQVVIMVHPKSAFKSDGIEIDNLKSEFADAGYKLIAVEYNNNSIQPPRFDVLRRY